MALEFDVDEVYRLFGNKGNNDLYQLLQFLKKEPSINTVKEASYALATFGAESAYRANCYESYYLNSGEYDSPRNASPKFVRWASKKTNYEGGRYPNGVPKYIGRGLIQITHDYNYERYSKVVPGLASNPELALNTPNAWLIAMEYFRTRKTLQTAEAGNLTTARKSVNGGTNGIDTVNSNYSKWIKTFEQAGAQPKSGGEGVLASNQERGGKVANEEIYGTGESNPEDLAYQTKQADKDKADKNTDKPGISSQNVNEQIDQENSKQEAEVLALLKNISSQVLTNEQASNSSDSKTLGDNEKDVLKGKDGKTWEYKRIG